MEPMGTKCSSIFRSLLKDERGDTQPIVMTALLGVLLMVIYLGIVTAQYVTVVNEINDVTDNVLRDAMKVNNGLTPLWQSQIISMLEAKGLDPARITVSGTPSPVGFGTAMTGTVEYLYPTSLFQPTAGLFPNIQEQYIPIRSRVFTFALGIVR